jgi:hypothetical protein
MRVMRLIKLIIMSRRLFWMQLKEQEVVQGGVHVPYDLHVPHEQGQAHREVQGFLFWFFNPDLPIYLPYIYTFDIHELLAYGRQLPLK